MTRADRERREREVERMAKRIMGRGDAYIGSERKWDKATDCERRWAVGVARYVLRLLAAERRKAAKRARGYVLQGYNAGTFSRVEEVMDMCERAILGRTR